VAGQAPLRQYAPKSAGPHLGQGELVRHRCDAGTGALFLGAGNGQFNWCNNLASGFWAAGEVRDMAALRSAGGKMTIVVANNSGKAQVFQMK